MAYRNYGGDYPTATSQDIPAKAPSGSTPLRMTAREVMSKKLFCTTAEQPIMDLVKQLEKHRISGMPVVDDKGQLIGVISEKDTFKLILQSNFTQAIAGKVGDYMTKEVETLSPEDDIFKIANLFYTKSFRRLPVIEDGKVIGLISRRDVLHALNSMGD